MTLSWNDNYALNKTALVDEGGLGEAGPAGESGESIVEKWWIKALDFLEEWWGCSSVLLARFFSVFGVSSCWVSSWLKESRSTGSSVLSSQDHWSCSLLLGISWSLDVPCSGLNMKMTSCSCSSGCCCTGGDWGCSNNQLSEVIVSMACCLRTWFHNLVLFGYLSMYSSSTCVGIYLVVNKIFLSGSSFLGIIEGYILYWLASANLLINVSLA